MKLWHENRTNVERAYISFDVLDRLNRVVGCEVITYEHDIVEAPQDAISYYTSGNLGHAYIGSVQATRNGKSYGAGQGGKAFSSKLERALYIAKRIENSRIKAQGKEPF